MWCIEGAMAIIKHGILLAAQYTLPDWVFILMTFISLFISDSFQDTFLHFYTNKTSQNFDIFHNFLGAFQHFWSI